MKRIAAAASAVKHIRWMSVLMALSLTVLYGAFEAHGRELAPASSASQASSRIPSTLSRERYALANLTSAVSTPSRSSEAQITPETVRRIDTYVEMWRDKGHIPGISIGAYRRGVPIVAKGYGMADLEHNVPATKETLYQLASSSKQFTAAAVMILVEEGKIELDKSATVYLSGLPEEWSEVTVRHLLTHTCGIASYTDDPAIWKRHALKITKEELLEVVTNYPMVFTPGEQWSYCDTGYVLLGLTIEEVSGMSYAEFMKQRIFDPLGMKNTHIDDGRMILPDRARGYAWENGRLSNARYFDPSWPYAAGSVISNVVDLAKWDRALYSNVLLPQARLSEMWTPVELNDGSTFPYGFGWGVLEINGHPCLAHCGGIAGFHSCICRFPEDELTVVVLQNEEFLQEPPDLMKAAFNAQSIAGFIEPELAVKAAPLIHDGSPKVTEAGRTFLSRLIDGESIREWCTESCWERSADTFSTYQDFFQPFRPCNDIDLVDRTTTDDLTVDTHRLAFPATTFLIQLHIESALKVEGMNILEEVPH